MITFINAYIIIIDIFIVKTIIINDTNTTFITYIDVIVEIFRSYFISLFKLFEFARPMFKSLKLFSLIFADSSILFFKFSKLAILITDFFLLLNLLKSFVFLVKTVVPLFSLFLLKINDLLTLYRTYNH